MAYYDDLIHEEFIENMGHLFSNAKIVNFDIIYRECRGDGLKNPKSYWETIKKQDFKNYEDDVQNQAMSSVIKSERDDVRLERHLLKSHRNRSDFKYIFY